MPLLNPARAAGWLAALYPLPVHAAELPLRDDDTLSAALLSEAEWQSIRHAADGRIRDFTAGRVCARQALGALGIQGFDLLPGPDRAPVWPEGVIGSITHTQGFSAAVVARRGQLRGLGIDTEVIDAMTPEIWPAICAPEEIEWLRSRRLQERGITAALIFTAKEAFYKCQYPSLGVAIAFSKAVVRVRESDCGCDPPLQSGYFQVALTEPGNELLAGSAWHGRFQRHGPLITAAVARPAGPDP